MLMLRCALPFQRSLAQPSEIERPNEQKSGTHSGTHPRELVSVLIPVYERNHIMMERIEASLKGRSLNMSSRELLK